MEGVEVKNEGNPSEVLFSAPRRVLNLPYNFADFFFIYRIEGGDFFARCAALF